MQRSNNTPPAPRLKRKTPKPHGQPKGTKRKSNNHTRNHEGIAESSICLANPSIGRRTSALRLPELNSHDQSTRFPFFQLPCEIRDIILAFCILPSGTRITGGTEPPGPHHGWFEDLVEPMTLYCPLRPSLALLTVSKQMHEEASYNLYSRSCFEFLISTTHIANIFNQDDIENNTVQIASHYLSRIRKMTLFVYIHAYCCKLPQFQYVRVKNALQHLADTLNAEDGHSIERLHIKYAEFESRHGRSDHQRYHQREDTSWTRTQVMDHLRTEYFSAHDHSRHDLSGTDDSEKVLSTKYQNVLEPLGTIFHIPEVQVVGVEAGFAAQLEAAMQSVKKVCRPIDKQPHETRRTRTRWWLPTIQWTNNILERTSKVGESRR